MKTQQNLENRRAAEDDHGYHQSTLPRYLLLASTLSAPPAAHDAHAARQMVEPADQAIAAGEAILMRADRRYHIQQMNFSAAGWAGQYKVCVQKGLLRARARGVRSRGAKLC